MNNLFMVLADASTVCTEIPDQIITLTGTLYTIIKIGIPLLLIVYGMLDFGRAVIAGKEDEIKSHQKIFIKRLISAVLVFFILSIVELLLGILDVDEGVMGCIKTILGAN